MDCHVYPTLDMEAWGAQLKAPLGGGRYPFSATFELTSRCNLNCAHCYINQPANDPAVRQRELTTAQVKQVIDEMVAAGVLFLTLTGGEPLLRPDFAEIYTYALRKGLLVTLFTNGTLLSDELLRLLTDMRPFNVEISIYGATATVFEQVTRLPGSFTRCYRAIDRILEAGLPLTLKSELMTLNAHELEPMKALAERLGVKFRYDGLLWPRIDGRGEFPRAVQLPLENLVAFDNQDPERQDELAVELERLKGLTTRDARVFSCGAGLHSFHLDSEGRMSICMMVRQPAYNLLEMPLIEAWEALGKLREMKRNAVSKCQSCPTNTLCTHCPGWSLAVHHDFESVVEFTCEHGLLRSKNAINIKNRQMMEVI